MLSSCLLDAAIHRDGHLSSAEEQLLEPPSAARLHDARHRRSCAAANIIEIELQWEEAGSQVIGPGQRDLVIERTMRWTGFSL